MDRPPDASGQGYGICVKGGKEAGGGVYISRVEPGSVAERAGLRPGDSILQANGTPFRGITHEEALKMLKSCRTLSMTVESSPQASVVPEPLPLRQHAIPRIPPPGACRYSWVDRVGRPVSPPPPSGGAPRSPPNREGSIRKVELSIEPGQSLGLMIRGGAEYDLGVFVTGVDEGSAAERAGLKVGDQILEVNGVSFLSLSHDEAVHRLKHPRRMTLTVRDVGRVPHSSSLSGRSPFDSGGFGAAFPPPETAPYLQTTSDEEEMAVAPDDDEEEQRLLLPWCASGLPSSSAAVDGGGARGALGCPSLQMVEEKARRVLRKSEFATLAYYMREYAARRMAIDAFLAVLLEMLSTPEKYTLLTELREVVALEDRARFDELVYRREAEGQRCRELRQMLMAGSPSNAAARCGYLDGLRSHLGDWTQRVKSWYWGRPPEPPGGVGGVFEGLPVGGDESTTGEETGAEAGDGPGGGRGGPAGGRRPLLAGGAGAESAAGQTGEYADGENAGNSSVVADQQGNLRITVRKTRPMLGIAIEGGANTKHPLPRIINIHEDGAAFEAGGLEVGQLILEVDGQKVEGLGHQEVARLIAESFARKSRPGIEFLVIEAKKSNLEPKPTALIFLET